MGWKRHGWFLIGVLTLALGIGATTALFTVVQGVLLKPLPVPHPEQVLEVAEASRRAPALAVSYQDFLDWQSRARAFAAMAAFQPSDMALTHLGTPEFVPGERVSGQYFALLGAHAALGRMLTQADNAAGAPAVVVVSSKFWQEKLGANPAWLGRAIELDGVTRTIVGVMPQGYPLAGGAAQFWTPLGTYVAKNPQVAKRGSRLALLVVARMRSGVTLAGAQRDLQAVAAQLAQQFPASNKGITASAQPLLDGLTGSTRPVLWGLLAAAGLLLLLACSNVANLLLARGAGQSQQDAVRAALGASPARLLRRRLGEGFALGLVGAGAGCGLAILALHVAPLLTASLPRTQHFGLNAAVLGFAAALAIVTALVCGLAPALHAAHVSPASLLAYAREGAGAGHRRGRALLVGSQLALALLLLAGAGLLLRSVARVEAVNPGFNPKGTLTFVTGLPTSSYPTRAGQLAFFQQAQQRLAHIPGVVAAGGAFGLPFATGGIALPVGIVGRTPAPAGQKPTADVANVAGDYFNAMGMHLLAGRRFSSADSTQGAPVAIVDATFVRHFWPSASPSAVLGRAIDVAGQKREIVGVVNHVRESGLTGPGATPEAYVPQQQAALFTNVLFFVLRTRLADPMTLRAAAAAQIQALDATQPITEVQTMASLVASTTAQSRLVLDLLLAFAVLALILAAIGVYSALSFAVAARTREIGVRMALGAERRQVLGAVLAQGMKPAWIGAAVGIGLVLGFGHLAAAFLPGVSAHDPLTLALAVIVLLAVAAVACLIPARRAASVDPLDALREP